MCSTNFASSVSLIELGGEFSMTNNGNFNGDDFARFFGLANGRLTIHLHDDRVCKISSREKHMLDGQNSGASTCPPKRRTRAELLQFLQQHGYVDVLRERLGSFGHLKLTIKDGRATYYGWCRGEKP
jgi:hypothetical protein